MVCTGNPGIDNCLCRCGSFECMDQVPRITRQSEMNVIENRLRGSRYKGSKRYRFKIFNGFLAQEVLGSRRSRGFGSRRSRSSRDSEGYRFKKFKRFSGYRIKGS